MKRSAEPDRRSSAMQLAPGFKGAIAHMSIWNRLLSAAEIGSIWTAGAGDLRGSAMYHSYL